MLQERVTPDSSLQELFVMGTAGLNPYSDPSSTIHNATADAAIISADQENLVPVERFELSNTCF